MKRLFLFSIVPFLCLNTLWADSLNRTIRSCTLNKSTRQEAIRNIQELGATIVIEDTDAVLLEGTVYIEKYPMTHIILAFQNDTLSDMIIIDNLKAEHPEMWDSYLQKFHNWYGNNYRTIYEDNIAMALIEATLVEWGANKDDVVSYIDDETMFALITTPTSGVLCVYDLTKIKKEATTNMTTMLEGGDDIADNQ